MDSKFEIVVWENITSFNQFPALSKELAGNCKRMGLRYRRFDDFEPSTLLGGQVLVKLMNTISAHQAAPVTLKDVSKWHLFIGGCD